MQRPGMRLWPQNSPSVNKNGDFELATAGASAGFNHTCEDA
jgi:hypothetical protein